jgi:hypothetical protein
LRKTIPAIDNLFEGQKEEVLAVLEKITNSTATKSDLSTLMKIAQQNHRAFTTFQLSLLIRLAEIEFRGTNLLDSNEYIKENAFAAFDLRRQFLE